MAVNGNESRSYCSLMNNESETNAQTVTIALPSYSEVPVTAPSSNALENAPPPSNKGIVNPEAPPPSYQSLFGQMREAHENSSGCMDCVIQIINLLLDAISCSIIFGITNAVSISMTLVGAIYFGDCPVEKYIPVYLIVGGTFGIVRSVLGSCKTNENDQQCSIHNCQERILDSFLFACSTHARLLTRYGALLLVYTYIGRRAYSPTAWSRFRQFESKLWCQQSSEGVEEEWHSLGVSEPLLLNIYLHWALLHVSDLYPGLCLRLQAPRTVLKSHFVQPSSFC
ncbi:uncharacterized protein NPIL_193801 [Nephila pilipes]|uniref:Transmembrane protein n=1 Tax=Nephila pilipes TaxID=299642 RepID=A0A8X6UEF4_NEPPI|nr:uncharacterized protein NPIL_193801 [Nephila pilipes]